jgi:hypothetical protein
LAGAQVQIFAFKGSDGRIQPGEMSTREYSIFTSPSSEGGGKPVTTDAQGRWRADRFPSDAENVRITVIRDDGSDADYATKPARRPYSRPVPAVSLSELRAGTALLTIPSGFVAHGRVVNAEGAPVADAKVLEIDHKWEVRGQVTTDADGRFHFRNRLARQRIWTVEAPGFALACQIVNLEPGMPEEIVQLEPARPTVLHVRRPDGQPAAGLTVKPLPVLNEGVYLNFESRTGPDGTLVLSNAPVQVVCAALRLPGGRMRTVCFWAGHTQTVTLTDQPQNEVVVTVRVTDARTRRPLESFELSRVERDPQGSERVRLWAVGSNGLAQGKLRLTDIQQAAYPTVFRATAKGYLPGANTRLDLVEKIDLGFNLELEPDHPVHGNVHQPDHSPAANAWVIVSRDGEPLFSEAASQRGPVAPPSRSNLNKTQSSHDGSFRLEGVREDAAVIALHESGYAQIPARELRANGRIALRPWERIEGVLKIGEANGGAGQRVGLARVVTAGKSSPTHYEARTDGDGAFRFERLAAGSYKVFRYLDNKSGRIVYSHRQTVEVLPGVPTKVELGGRGVRVEGRLTSSNSETVDWTLDRHILTSRSSPLPAGPFREDFVRDADYEEARRMRAFRPEPSAEYLLSLDQEGHFFVDDVLPGDYTLEVKVTEPLPSSRSNGQPGRIIGTLSKNIVIPHLQSGESPKVQLETFVLATDRTPSKPDCEWTD